MKTWTCTVCGWVYDEAKGDPDYDLAPGVKFRLSLVRCGQGYV